MICFFFSDPGGTKALLSLANNYKSKGVPMALYSDRNYDFYQDFKLEVNQIEVDDVAAILMRQPVTEIFTGTSYTSDLEKIAIKTAKESGIYSTAFIDHWTEISSRFVLKGEKIYPDVIWVIDGKALSIALEQGLPPERVRIHRNPYYDFIKKWKPDMDKQMWEKQLQVNPASRYILFVPEPLSNAGGAEKFGIDEYIALDILVNTLKHSGRTDYNLLVKPHPNQNLGQMAECINKASGSVRLQLIEQSHTNTSLYYSDYVVGIFSNILIEASFFDKKIFRIIDGLKVADPIRHLGIGNLLVTGQSFPF